MINPHKHDFAQIISLEQTSTTFKLNRLSSEPSMRTLVRNLESKKQNKINPLASLCSRPHCRERSVCMKQPAPIILCITENTVLTQPRQ